MPSPPFPHSLLNRRIPVTIMVSSKSCLSLSLLVSDMKVPNSVCGKTLCKAATIKIITCVHFYEEVLEIQMEAQRK